MTSTPQPVPKPGRPSRDHHGASQWSLSSSSHIEQTMPAASDSSFTGAAHWATPSQSRPPLMSSVSVQEFSRNDPSSDPEGTFIRHSSHPLNTSAPPYTLRPEMRSLNLSDRPSSTPRGDAATPGQSQNTSSYHGVAQSASGQRYLPEQAQAERRVQVTPQRPSQPGRLHYPSESSPIGAQPSPTNLPHEDVDFSQGVAGGKPSPRSGHERLPSSPHLGHAGPTYQQRSFSQTDGERSQQPHTVSMPSLSALHAEYPSEHAQTDQPSRADHESELARLCQEMGQREEQLSKEFEELSASRKMFSEKAIGFLQVCV